MVNIECQSSSFLFDDPSHYLRKMSSSSNLYDYLTNNISIKMLLNNTDDDDLSTTTSPTTMTNSDSSDSAIVSDEVDDFDESQSPYRNSWPKMLKKPDLTMPTTFAFLSQSFDILNQFEEQTIYETTSKNNQQKYKRPLPWLNSISATPQCSSLELTPKKVFNDLFIKKKEDSFQ